MRSSTTFFIFIGLVVVVLLLGTISSQTTANDPVVRSAQTFLKGLHANDAATVDRVLDARNANLINAGARVVSIKFGGIAPGGAFMKRPEVLWMYSDLSQMQLDKTAQPVTAADMATVACGAFKLYLRQVDGVWKVFYIDKPEEKTP
jgi:hypothetical protein